MSEAYDASNRSHVRAAEKASRLAESQRREAIGGIMSNSYGRAWLWDILNRCHVFGSSFSSNSYQTAFSEGERNVGLQFLNDIMTHCPDRYVVMAQEANQRELTNGRRRSDSSNAPDRDSSNASSGSSDDTGDAED